MAERLKFKRGDTWDAVFTWLSDGQPADLTGCSARLQLRRSIASDPADVTLSSAGGELTMGGTAGTITMRVPKATTEAAQPKVYLADLEVTFADASILSSETFEIEVVADVTV